MWFIISSLPLLRKALSIFTIGLVIKIMDDYTDQDIDILANEPNIFVILGLGGLPYVLLLLSLAFILDPPSSLSLFMASYAIGMAGSLSVKMPSGLYGFQESILVILLSFFFLESTNIISSILIITSIQLWDDYLDYEKDKFNKKNWAFVLGKVECFLLGIIFFLLSFYLDYMKAISAIISAKVIIYTINILLNKITLNEAV